VAAKEGKLEAFQAAQRDALEAFDRQYGIGQSPTGPEAGKSRSEVVPIESAPGSGPDHNRAGTSGTGKDDSGVGKDGGKTMKEGINERAMMEKETGGMPREKGEQGPTLNEGAPRTSTRDSVPKPNPLAGLRYMKANVALPNMDRRSPEEATEVDGGSDEGLEDDEEVVEVTRKGKRVERRKRAPRAVPVAIDRYHHPRCERCQRLNKLCQGQTKIGGACFVCAKHKLACRGEKGPLHDLPMTAAGHPVEGVVVMVRSAPNDGEEEGPIEGSARRVRKRKGKSHALTSQFFINLLGYSAPDTGDDEELPREKRPAPRRPAPLRSARGFRPDKKGKQKGKPHDSCMRGLRSCIVSSHRCRL
jgi:hypothetical protein